jgi:hypothetical protein
MNQPAVSREKRRRGGKWNILLLVWMNGKWSFRFISCHGVEVAVGTQHLTAFTKNSLVMNLMLGLTEEKNQGPWSWSKIEADDIPDDPGSILSWGQLADLVQKVWAGSHNSEPS